jgi:hypothetical protein
MLDIFAEYATDESLENGGTYFPFGGGSRLLVARSGNRRFGKALTVLVNENRLVLDQDDELANAKSNEIMASAMATGVLLGWEGISYKGKSLSYSFENAKMLLAHNDFRREVVALSENASAYKAKLELEQGEA